MGLLTSLLSAGAQVETGVVEHTEQQSNGEELQNLLKDLVGGPCPGRVPGYDPVGGVENLRFSEQWP